MGKQYLPAFRKPWQDESKASGIIRRLEGMGKGDRVGPNIGQ